VPGAAAFRAADAGQAAMPDNAAPPAFVTPMPTEPAVASIAHVIQLSVAPVFLLSGVGALLAVLTNRLARIVDRARALEAQFPAAAATRVPAMRSGLARLAQRARLIGWAIGLCTGCALLICAVIVVLFVGTAVNVRLGAVIATGFVGAMLMLIGGLSCFLREVMVATRNLRIGEFEGEMPASSSPS
jgi:hypothetical protein